MARVFVALLVLGGGYFVGCDQSTSSSTDGALVAANHDPNPSPAADSHTAGQSDDDPITPPPEEVDTEDGVIDSPPDDSLEEPPACDPLATIFRDGMRMLCEPHETSCFLHLDLASCLWSCGEYPNGDPPYSISDIPQDPLTITPENLAKDQCEIVNE